MKSFDFFGFFFGVYEDFLSEQPLESNAACLTCPNRSTSRVAARPILGLQGVPTGFVVVVEVA